MLLLWNHHWQFVCVYSDISTGEIRSRRRWHPIICTCQGCQHLHPYPAQSSSTTDDRWLLTSPVLWLMRKRSPMLPSSTATAAAAATLQKRTPLRFRRRCHPSVRCWWAARAACRLFSSFWLSCSMTIDSVCITCCHVPSCFSVLPVKVLYTV